jgi:hypothetical protein
MSTRAEQIIDEFMDVLTTPTSVASGAVWRSRWRPIPEGTALAVVVRRKTDARLGPTTLDRQQRQLQVAVEVYARGDEPDALADPLIEAVMARVMADRTLGGLCDDIEVDSVDPEWAARDTDLVVMDLTFNVQYEIANTEL